MTPSLNDRDMDLSAKRLFNVNVDLSGRPGGPIDQTVTDFDFNVPIRQGAFEEPHDPFESLAVLEAWIPGTAGGAPAVPKPLGCSGHGFSNSLQIGLVGSVHTPPFCPSHYSDCRGVPLHSTRRSTSSTVWPAGLMAWAPMTAPASSWVPELGCALGFAGSHAESHSCDEPIVAADGVKQRTRDSNRAPVRRMKCRALNVR